MFWNMFWRPCWHVFWLLSCHQVRHVFCPIFWHVLLTCALTKLACAVATWSDVGSDMCWACVLPWHLFRHSFWHSIWCPTWHVFWHLSWQISWHLFWHCSWPSVWNLFQLSFRHSTWNLFWHSCWHSTWYLFQHDFILSGIYSDILFTILSAISPDRWGKDFLFELQQSPLKRLIAQK